MTEPGNATQADQPIDTGRRLAYWKANLLYLAILLSVWFIVSFGFGILLVEPLNRFTIGGAPAGFWFAQQGSIYVFVALILIYVRLMNRLDRRWGFRED
jgi:putative solute:sodium symporter small subunit